MSMLRVFALLLVLSACSTDKDLFITHNGNMPVDEKIAKVAIGQSKEDVQELLGTPSAVISLDQNTWLYMSADVKRVAFFRPEEVDRDLLTIKFNKDNKVADIKRMTRKEGQEVAVAQEKTETLGHTPGFFTRFFGGTRTYAPMGAYGGGQGM